MMSFEDENAEAFFNEYRYGLPEKPERMSDQLDAIAGWLDRLDELADIPPTDVDVQVDLRDIAVYLRDPREGR